jgi:hypothetical protein
MRATGSRSRIGDAPHSTRFWRGTAETDGALRPPDRADWANGLTRNPEN